VPALRSALGRERPVRLLLPRAPPGSDAESVSAGPRRRPASSPSIHAAELGRSSFERGRGAAAPGECAAPGGWSTSGRAGGGRRASFLSAPRRAESSASAGQPPGLPGFRASHASAHHFAYAVVFGVPALLAHLSDATLYGALRLRRSMGARAITGKPM
jgi:hypothetical protein